jgi:hypothetical protein
VWRTGCRGRRRPRRSRALTCFGRPSASRIAGTGTDAPSIVIASDTR